LSEVLLRAVGISREFGAGVALEPTDLELHHGESVAVIGPNGAGKSTLLAIAAGALEPTTGHVELPNGTRVGWVPQRPAHYGRLTARENLELFASLENEQDVRASASALLEQFALPDDSKPSADLSVGNRQRLNVALSFLGRPEALLLDEPTASLDPGQRRRLWETLRGALAEGGAVCFATQNLEELDAFADRVLVLQDGHVEYAGPVDGYRSVATGVFG
jgi:ABC-type multidrug transport system ATPase subunit